MKYYCDLKFLASESLKILVPKHSTWSRREVLLFWKTLSKNQGLFAGSDKTAVEAILYVFITMLNSFIRPKKYSSIKTILLLEVTTDAFAGPVFVKKSGVFLN